MQIDVPQPTVSGRRNHSDRNEQRHDNRHRNGKRQVRKELRGEVLQKQDRQEDRHRRCGRRQQGAPDLLRALQRCDGTSLSVFPQPDDVLQHDDGGVQHQPHGECQRSQGNHVERSPGQVEREEREEQRDRDRRSDDSGPLEAAKEPPQDAHGQRDSKQQIVPQRRDGLHDVFGLVIDLSNNQAFPRQGTFLKFAGRFPHALHDLENVDAFFRLDADGHRRTALLGQYDHLVHEAPLHRGDVAQAHGVPVTPAQDHVLEFGDSVLTRVSNRVLAPANVGKAARRIDIVPGQRDDRRKLDIQRGGLVRIERDANLGFAAAEYYGGSHAVDALESRLNHFFHKIQVRVDIVRVTCGQAQ